MSRNDQLNCHGSDDALVSGCAQAEWGAIEEMGRGSPGLLGLFLASRRTFIIIASSLYMKLQVANFQRCKCASDSSKEPKPVPLTSDVGDVAACPPSPIADDPSALPSSTSSPSSSSKSPCLFT